MDCYRCLIQWGYQTVHGTNPVTYDLPIPFEEAPFTVAISTGNSGNHASCGGFTKTTIVLRAGTTAGVWDTVGFFIIGCQLQWGYLQQQAEKWIYPIPVLEAFIATKTCISNNHSAAGYVGYWTWDKDITTEYAYSWNNYPSYCFMIGKVQQQWGKYTNSGNDRVITYPIAFSELYYANVISSDNCETFVYGISNININYRLCNGYNDDRWNGTQTSRLFAVGR